MKQKISTQLSLALLIGLLAGSVRVVAMTGGSIRPLEAHLHDLAVAFIVTLSMMLAVTIPFVRSDESQNLAMPTLIGVWIMVGLSTFFLFGIVPLIEHEEPYGIGLLFAIWSFLGVLCLPIMIRYWQNQRAQLSLRSVLFVTFVVALLLAPPAPLMRLLHYLAELWLRVLPDRHDAAVSGAMSGLQTTFFQQATTQWFAHGGCHWTCGIAIFLIATLQMWHGRSSRYLLANWWLIPGRLVRDQFRPTIIAILCWLTVYIWLAPQPGPPPKATPIQVTRATSTSV